MAMGASATPTLSLAIGKGNNANTNQWKEDMENIFEKLGKDYVNGWLDKQELHSNPPTLSDLKEAFVEGYKFAMLKAKEWVEKESASTMAEENGNDFLNYMMYDRYEI